MIYGIRLSMEFLFAAGATFVGIYIFNSKIIALLLVTIALFIPILIVRGATYGASLDLIADTDAVRELFDRDSEIRTESQ